MATKKIAKENWDITTSYVLGILSIILAWFCANTIQCGTGDWFCGLQCIIYLIPLAFVSIPLLIFALIRTFRDNLDKKRLIFVLAPFVLFMAFGRENLSSLLVLLEQDIRSYIYLAIPVVAIFILERIFIKYKLRKYFK